MCKNEKDSSLIISRFFYFSSTVNADSSDIHINAINNDSSNNESVLSDYENSDLSNQKYFFQEPIKLELHKEDKEIEASNSRTEIKEVSDSSSESTGSGERTVTNFADGSMMIAPMALIGEDELEVLQEMRDTFNNFNDRFNFDNMDLVPGPMDGNWVTFFRMQTWAIIDSIELAFESFYVSSPNSTSDTSSDGFFIRMIKAQTRAIMSTVNDLKIEFEPFYVSSPNDTTDNSYDGYFVRMIKAQTRAIMSSVTDLGQQFDLFYVSTPTATTDNASDGWFVRMIKTQTRAIMSSVTGLGGKFDLFKVSSPTSITDNASDGSFVRMIKAQSRAIMESVTDLGDKFEMFYVSSPNSTDDNSSDSYFVRMIKAQTRAIMSSVTDLGDKFEMFYVSSPNSTDDNTSDSFFVRMIKAQTRAIVKAISSISGVKPPATDGDTILSDLLKSVQNIEKKITDFTNGFDNETGSSFWDFLSNFSGQLFELVEFLVDRIIYLVVPEDVGFINDAFENLRSVISTKFEPLDILKVQIQGSLMVEQQNFEDIYMDLPVYGRVKFLDVEFLLVAIPKIRALLSGIMLILTSVWAYRKISSGMIK